MRNKLIISIDPGDKYVGIFAYTPQGFVVKQIELQGNSLEHISQVVNVLDSIRETNTNVDEKVLLVENYINYIHKQSIKGFKNNPTSEMIGYLKQYAVRYDFNYITQTASQAKIWSNERLIRLGLLNEINGRFYFLNEPIPKHTRDAYRHFIYYTNKNWFDNKITLEKLKEK